MYYGFLESISLKKNYFELEFDSFEKHRFSKILDNSTRRFSYEDTSHITLRYQLEEKQDPGDLISRFKLDRWYYLVSGIGHFTGTARNIFIDTAERDISIKEIEKIDRRTKEGKDLFRYFSFSGTSPATHEELLALFKNQPKADYVAVYDVGQGNCNAICSSGNGIIQYYDFGKDIRNSYNTSPTPLRYCLSHKPCVVLSHWDKDHWLASKYFPKIKDVPWIVPNQSLGVSHKIFAADLSRHNSLYLWPDHLTHLSLPYGDIVKCIGRNRNDSGLAMKIRLSSDTGQTKNIILPGDCSYRHIPNIPKKIHGLVASHHGGNVYGYLPSPAAPKSTIVFSASTNSPYGHPLPRMVSRYSNLGWINVRTHGQHIGLSGSQHIIGCEGRYCDLKITKWCQI